MDSAARWRACSSEGSGSIEPAAEDDGPEQRFAPAAFAGARDDVAGGVAEHLLGAGIGRLIVAEFGGEALDAADFHSTSL